MPIVTENFDMEEYPHVEALMASVQGVFFDPVHYQCKYNTYGKAIGCL